MTEADIYSQDESLNDSLESAVKIPILLKFILVVEERFMSLSDISRLSTTLSLGCLRLLHGWHQAISKERATSWM